MSGVLRTECIGNKKPMPRPGIHACGSRRSSTEIACGSWVVGRTTRPTNWGDVWHSQDGKTWTELKSDVIWKARHEHSAFVFQDKIWIAGGHARPLSSEVWSLELPE